MRFDILKNKNVTILIMACIILIFFNVIMLIWNFNLKKEINNLHAIEKLHKTQMVELNSTISRYTYQQTFEGVDISFKDLIPIFNSDDINNVFNKKYVIAILFADMVCTGCLQHDLTNLKLLNEEVKNCQIIGITKTIQLSV